MEPVGRATIQHQMTFDVVLLLASEQGKLCVACSEQGLQLSKCEQEGICWQELSEQELLYNCIFCNWFHRQFRPLKKNNAALIIVILF